MKSVKFDIMPLQESQPFRYIEVKMSCLRVYLSHPIFGAHRDTKMTRQVVDVSKHPTEQRKEGIEKEK